MTTIKRVPRPPCKKNGKDCPRRNEECHATCKEFADWTALREAYREAVHAEKAKANAVNEYVINGIMARKKKSNSRR